LDLEEVQRRVADRVMAWDDVDSIVAAVLTER
jgi:hypothetical protein